MRKDGLLYFCPLYCIGLYQVIKLGNDFPELRQKKICQECVLLSVFWELCIRKDSFSDHLCTSYFNKINKNDNAVVLLFLI